MWDCSETLAIVSNVAEAKGEKASQGIASGTAIADRPRTDPTQTKGHKQRGQASLISGKIRVSSLTATMGRIG